MQRILVETAGCVVWEQDGRLRLSARPAEASAVTLFVLGLLAFLLLANGALQVGLQLAGRGGSATAGLGMIGGAVVLGALFRRVWVGRRRRRALPPSTLPGLLAIDPARGMLLDEAGHPLAPLAEVRTARRFQAFSSSRALEVTWPGGRRVVARGSPFSGDVGPIEAELRRHGIAGR